jgi:hypothetical protein
MNQFFDRIAFNCIFLSKIKQQTLILERQNQQTVWVAITIDAEIQQT